LCWDPMHPMMTESVGSCLGSDFPSLLRIPRIFATYTHTSPTVCLSITTGSREVVVVCARATGWGPFLLMTVQFLWIQFPNKLCCPDHIQSVSHQHRLLLFIHFSLCALWRCTSSGMTFSCTGQCLFTCHFGVLPKTSKARRVL